MFNMSTTAESAAGLDGYFRIAIGAEFSTPLFYSASDAAVLNALHNMTNVGKVSMIGLKEYETMATKTFTGTCETGAAACTQSSQSYVFIPQNVSGMIAVGDSITIESTDHVITLIEFLIPDETKLTLDGTWTVGSSSTTITVNNAYVKSKTQLPGRASAEAVIVSSAVVGDTEITLTESITAGDYWIEGKSYELGASSGSDESGHVATINASPSCSGTTYCSTATSSLDSDETLYAFTKNVTLYTSKDWSTSLSSSDKIYTGDFEFSVQTVTGAKSITVSGENFRYPLEGAYFFKDGNGAERAVLFKLVDDDVSTSRALVNADWRGTDVQLRTHRADGISAGTYKIGGASEIQVVTFRTANPMNHTAFRMADDEYRQQYFAMTFGDSNSETSFGSAFYFGIGDSAEAWKYKLEMFDGIDRVSVERNGDGQSEFYSYGYAYTISFWGRYGTEGIPQIEIGEIRNNTNNINKWDMPFWTTHVETVRQAEYIGDFSSRHVALNENADFQVRMKAFNEKASPVPLMWCLVVPKITALYLVRLNLLFWDVTGATLCYLCLLTSPQIQVVYP